MRFVLEYNSSHFRNLTLANHRLNDQSSQRKWGIFRLLCDDAKNKTDRNFEQEVGEENKLV